jgi:hypothetical protein
MNATSLRSSNIFLVAHSQFRAVNIGLAKKLANDIGAFLHLYVKNKQERAHYQKNAPGIFYAIHVAPALYQVRDVDSIDEEALFSCARGMEAELDITINELSMTDRHLGRGFALGGFRHPRSRISECTTRASVVASYLSEIDFWRDELSSYEPALILGGGKVLCTLARRLGIPQRIITGARYKSYYYWGVNEYRECPVLEAKYVQATSDNDESVESPYQAHLKFRDRMEREAAFSIMVKSLAMTLTRHVYWKLRGYEKAKGYYLREKLGLTLRRSRLLNQLNRSPYSTLDELVRSGPYVFFPLATEPEAALQVLSPEYFFQLSAIAAISRDLPAGYMLAVKEHYPAVGRRPADFYAQIVELKNVRLVRIGEYGLDLVKKAAAVATISGSAGLEGAAIGKPVIAFGQHNLFNFLPHVHVVRGDLSLRRVLRHMLSDEKSAAERAKVGKRFLAALRSTAFDMSGFYPSAPDHAPDAAVEGAFQSLLESLHWRPLP